MSADADIAIAAIEGAALRLAKAVTNEMNLEDLRALEKVLAIHRIMERGPNELSGKPHSVSSAEAIVESDEGYLAHRAKQREAVANTILCRGKLKAAELRAQLAVEQAKANGNDYEIVDDRLQVAVEDIDKMLDAAGIIDRDDTGKLLPIVERVRLLIAEVWQREVA